MTDRPLSARSVVASTLLGTVPPVLPGRLLVAFAAEFGIQPGATRTALSRLAERGELIHHDDGRYELAGALRARHDRQEAGLQPDDRGWDGSWELRIVPAGARASTDRAALRRACEHLGLWERRDGVWLRPANLDPERLPEVRRMVDEQTEAFTAQPRGDAAALVAELLDLDRWADPARALVVELDRLGEALTADDRLADGFVLAARTLRHLVADPSLPTELAPPDWPATTLRAAYRRYDVAYRATLRRFFRAQSAPVQ